MKNAVTHKFIPVAEPALIGNEKKYVMDCMDTGWISSAGEYVARFEKALAEVCQVKHAVVCANGTVALHLALATLGIKSGDEVIVPTLTFIASANAVRYTGATPILVDSEPESWLLDLNKTEAAITPRTRAIMPVDIYGHPAPADEVRDLARRHGLLVIGDAAESLGATYKGQPVGGLYDISTFSFFGNKTITTGEGGAVLTNDDVLAKQARLLRGQGQDPERRYWFIEMGYNYRMTNIQAAIGLAQLEQIVWHVQRRREVAGWYRARVQKQLPQVHIQIEQPWATSSYWLNSFVFPTEFPYDRDETMRLLRQRYNIETRPFFYPLHILPIYCDTNRHPCPTAEAIAAQGISFPSSARLSEEDVSYIVDSLQELSESR